MAALLIASMGVAQAQLKITEAESSEAVGSFTTADWFELSNLSASPVTITGYKMDDNSDSFALSVALSGITSIAAGESVVFFEQTGATPLTVTGFQNWWGSSLGSSVQIGTYSGSGVGLSGTADHVNVFDGAGATVDQVIFTTATAGDTFQFDGNGSSGRSPSGLSVNGVNGAFTSGNGDIGSPGVAPVPEPTTMALAGLGGLAALVALRRRK